jgi:hypothetical protein
MFAVNDRVALKQCPTQTYIISEVRELGDTAMYDPPTAYRMGCGAFWPEQCLIAAPKPTEIDAHLEEAKANIRRLYGRKKAAALIAELESW